MAVKHKKAVFLDKDGTIIVNEPYNTDISLISFYPDTVESLAKLQKQGYELIIISNQSGVAHGIFKDSDARQAFRYIQNMLKKDGVLIKDYFYCPHHPAGVVSAYRAQCGCRKPAPGLLLKAAEKYGIDLSESWMIGDILDDVEAGNRAGCQSVLINNGNETEWLAGPYRKAAESVETLGQAVDLILNARGEHE